MRPRSINVLRPVSGVLNFGNFELRPKIGSSEILFNDPAV